MSFDPIANGWRKLLKDGGVGYNKKEVITFDGNVEGKTTVLLQEQFPYAKISDVINLEQITKIVFEGVENDGTHVTAEMSPDMWAVGDWSDGLTGLALDGLLAAFNSDGSVHPSGFYVVAIEEAHVSRVEFNASHRIDPKFMPESFEIINLNDFDIYMMNIMSSGETVIETTAGAAFLAYAYKAFESGRLPIPYDKNAQIYLVPSGITEGQITGSLVGAMPSGETITFIKADIIILEDRIAMFTTMLN